MGWVYIEHMNKYSSVHMNFETEACMRDMKIEKSCCCNGNGHEHHSHNHNHPDNHHGHSEERGCDNIDSCKTDEGNCSCGSCNIDRKNQEENVSRSSDYAVYLIENLGCANCAAKMETKIRELPGIEDAVVVFSTKQLRLKTKNPEKYIKEITKICNSIESGINIVSRDKKESDSKVEYGKKSRLYDKISLGIGVSIFVIFVSIHLIFNFEYNYYMIAGFIVAYVLLGSGVLITAGKNIVNGQVFDENFLMSIATIGAIAIGDYPEAVGVMLFFRIGEMFEDHAVEKSRSQIMSAVDLRPEVVNLVEDDVVRTIKAEEARVGQTVLVRPGDRIPLDGIVIKGESRLDTSAITGEPVPVRVSSGDAVISGSVNTSGAIYIKIEKPLSESMVSRILDAVENAASSKPKIDNFITKFARIYTPIVVALALFTAFGIPALIGEAFKPWIYTALTFLVMSCPCALVLSVPLAFFCGIGAGSKRGILFKGGIVMEAMSKAKAVVMDKTGTITYGNFVLQKINTANGFDESTILNLAARCELNSTHPIAGSIVEYLGKDGLKGPDSVEEIAGKGISASIDNKKVLCGNTKLMALYNIDYKDFAKVSSGAQVLIAVDGIYAGNFVISDTIKPEAREAIARINEMGITTVMMTGDSKEEAEAVAEQTGVLQSFGQLLPEEKFDRMQGVRNIYGSTMFVGDGINDALVLAGADVGAAMGSGADAAIEAADLVFMNSNLDGVPTAIEISNNTVSIARQNVIGALAIKILIMLLGITGIYANMWLAIFADTGVAMLCILNSIRILMKKYK